METLKLRILIQHVKGADIAYLYNREAFDLLKIEKHTYDNSQFVEIGTKIEYGERKYVVESINLKMFPETYEMNHGYGVNLYSPTEQANYNCQLGVFVNDLK
jgi:hypothetical protein